MRRRATFWALAAVAWLVSHDAVYFAQLGPGADLSRMLRGAGHDYWGPMGLALVALGGLAAGTAVLRIHRLEGRARAVGASAPRPWRLRGVLRTWGALFLIVAVAFAVQENVEHARGHGHLIGTGALLGPEYPLAVPVIALISLAAALVASAVGGAETALLVAIAAAEHGHALRLYRSPVRLLRPAVRLVNGAADRTHGPRRGRAPPMTLGTTTS